MSRGDTRPSLCVAVGRRAIALLLSRLQLRMYGSVYPFLYSCDVRRVCLGPVSYNFLPPGMRLEGMWVSPGWHWVRFPIRGGFGCGCRLLLSDRHGILGCDDEHFLVS